MRDPGCAAGGPAISLFTRLRKYAMHDPSLSQTKYAMPSKYKRATKDAKCAVARKYCLAAWGKMVQNSSGPTNENVRNAEGWQKITEISCPVVN